MLPDASRILALEGNVREHHRFQISLLLGRFDRVACTREIQIDRDLAGENDRQVRDHAAFAGRQDDSNSPLRACPFQMAAQRNRDAEKSSARQTRAIESVSDCDSKRTSFQSAQTSPGEMTTQDRALAVTKFPDLKQLLAHSGDVGSFGWQGPSECDHYPVRQRSGPFREEPPALK